MNSVSSKTYIKGRNSHPGSFEESVKRVRSFYVDRVFLPSKLFFERLIFWEF